MSRKKGHRNTYSFKSNILNELNETEKPASWFKKLSAAIVANAVTEYLYALRAELNGKHKFTNICYGNTQVETSLSIRDCENFFRSSWFETLSESNGERLMRMVQELAEETA